jgi:hypothetical protein
MHRLSTLALAAGLLLTTVAALPPPPMPQNPSGGQPPPGPVAPPMVTPVPYGAPAPTATPSPNPQMLARAKSWFAQLQAGKIDRSQLAPGMGSLTDEQVTNVSAQIKNLGTPVTFEQQQTMTQNGVDYAIYLLTFGDGKKLDFIFAVNGQGKVAGLRLQPAP